MEEIAVLISAISAFAAVSSCLVALIVYRAQRNARRPQLRIDAGEIDEIDRDFAYTVVVRNEGQSPALNVWVRMEIQEWRNEQPVKNDRNTFTDTIAVLRPLEQREYELPTAVDSYVVAVEASARNCPSTSTRWSVGEDRGAVQSVIGYKGANIVEVTLGANSMKDFGKSEDEC